MFNMKRLDRWALTLLTALGFGCSGPSYHLRAEEVSPQITCEFKSDRQGEVIADVCRLGPAMIYETRYGSDGPGNENDSRRYYGYYTVNSKGSTIEIDTSTWTQVLPGHQVRTGDGYNNCKPFKPCDREVNRKDSKYWGFE